MGKLIYTAIMSLDGYVEDERGSIEWSAPGDEVLRFITQLERPLGTYLYGRRMYETMRYWERADRDLDQSLTLREFTSVWQSADKIVYSRTLESVSSAHTVIHRDFDPDAIRALKANAERDMSVGGSGLAGEAIRHGLVDELRLFMLPVVLGGGKSWLHAHVRLPLELVGTQPFANGAVFLRYHTRS